jgi:hypothetical protein
MHFNLPSRIGGGTHSRNFSEHEEWMLCMHIFMYDMQKYIIPLSHAAAAADAIPMELNGIRKYDKKSSVNYKQNNKNFSLFHFISFQF